MEKSSIAKMKKKEEVQVKVTKHVLSNPKIGLKFVQKSRLKTVLLIVDPNGPNW